MAQVGRGMIDATTGRRGRAGSIQRLCRWSPRTGHDRSLIFVALCTVAVATVLVLFQVPYRHTIRVGNATGAVGTGFYDPEGKGDFTYRWTTQQATVLLPQGVFPGEADVVLSGNRPGSVPPRVAIALENQPNRVGTEIRSTADFVPYPFRLPADGGAINPADMPGLTLRPSDTAVPPKENRALGVAVERVVVFTNPLRFGPVRPPSLALLLVLGMAAILALAALSAALPLVQLACVAYAPVLLAAAYLAGRRADDPGQQAHAVVGFTAAALIAFMIVFSRRLRARPWVHAVGALDGRVLVGIAVVVALGYAAYTSHRMFGRLYDDTHITLRYAQNLADGDGLRFNPGERPVEGYTNFLLTVFLAGCAKVGLPLLVMAKACSIVAALGVVVATYWLTTLVLPNAPGLLRALPSFVLAGCGWFAFFAAIGLETHLFALLIIVAACLTLRRAWPWAGLAFAAAYLTRPEGAGLWAVTLGWLIWGVVSPTLLPRFGKRAARPLTADGAWHDAPPTARALLSFALPFVVIAGVHEIWRLLYYGEPLPNTFYDKVGSTTQQVRRGLDYVTGSLPQLHPFVLAGLIALLLVPSVVVWNRAARYLALLVAAFVGYIVLVGGDFIGPRFLFHILPLVIVLVVAGMRSLLDVPWRIARRTSVDGWLHDAGSASPLAALSVALLAFWLFVPLAPLSTFITQRPASTHMREVTGLTALGEYLRANAPPNATLAIDAAGAAPYFSGLSTIDMLGLSDYHIAHSVAASGDGVPGHEKTDPLYVLARQPTYIAVGMSKLTSGGRPGRGLDVPGFDAQYARVAVVQMNATVVSPSLVLVVTSETDVQAAIDRGYTYGLYRRR